MNRAIPAVLLIHLSPRFNFIGYSLAKSRALVRFMYSPPCLPASESNDVSNWRNYDCLYLVSCATLNTEERELCDSRLRLFLSRRLFLKAKISPANEARARNNSRGARREIRGVRFHFARGICNLKIFVQICLDATDVFLHFPGREICKFPYYIKDRY